MSSNNKHNEPVLVLDGDRITRQGKNEYGQLGYSHTFNYLLHPLTYAILVALGRQGR